MTIFRARLRPKASPIPHTSTPRSPRPHRCQVLGTEHRRRTGSTQEPLRVSLPRAGRVGGVGQQIEVMRSGRRFREKNQDCCSRNYPGHRHLTLCAKATARSKERAPSLDEQDPAVAEDRPYGRSPRVNHQEVFVLRETVQYGTQRRQRLNRR